MCIRDRLCSFAGSFETMNIEQKRAALRTFIKKVVWDGENVHVYLFGDDSDNIEYPPIDEMCIRDRSCCAPCCTEDFGY